MEEKKQKLNKIIKTYSKNILRLQFKYSPIIANIMNRIRHMYRSKYKSFFFQIHIQCTRFPYHAHFLFPDKKIEKYEKSARRLRHGNSK